MKAKSFFSVGVLLAVAFTFSCSSPDDGEGGGGSSSSVGGKGDLSSSGGSVSTCSANFRTVTIGTQTWAAENLNCDVGGSKCYDNDPTNCAKYGRLYDWSTAMALPSSCNSTSCSSQIQSKHKGICPFGWHIPSNVDWDKLYRYADGTSGTESPYSSPLAGRYLKATSGWNDSGNGTDQYGFSALPGGHGHSDDSFYIVGSYGNWWSASEYEYNSGHAYYQDMYYDGESANCGIFDKSFLRSVRCVQD
jgi:uncharacterized protein (TIGR02145 family)